jgi:vacuolar protein sorting-associated protein 26
MVLIFYFSQNFIDNTGFSESTLACYNCTSLVCYIAHAVTSLMQFHHLSLVTSNCAHHIEVTICSHLDWMCPLRRYHLKDVIVGKIYFLLVRIKIKHMELEVRRRESTGSGPNTYNESETLAKYEIMDGAPVRGESIPIRLFLSPYDLTPTYRNINNKFSVKYYLNLVLVDEEDRRYFKQQEITMYRLE